MVSAVVDTSKIILLVENPLNFSRELNAQNTGPKKDSDWGSQKQYRERNEMGP